MRNDLEKETHCFVTEGNQINGDVLKWRRESVCLVVSVAHTTPRISHRGFNKPRLTIHAHRYEASIRRGFGRGYHVETEYPDS